MNSKVEIKTFYSELIKNCRFCIICCQLLIEILKKKKFIFTTVREEAVLLIGNMDNISEEMLEQTLDKKLMSNMRLKKSAHERQANMVSSGEWSSGNETEFIMFLERYID